MRDDFKKVICTDGRHKGWSSADAIGKAKGYKNRQKRDLRGEGNEWSYRSKESMNGSRGRGDKSFGEHLTPLIRYLRSNVGRKWNDVYSEIRKACPPGGAVLEHIYVHLWGYVERHAQFIDGKVYEEPRWCSGKYPTPLTDRGQDNTFYIDQKGILRRAPHQTKRRKEKPQNKFEVNGVVYVRKEKIWYKTALAPLPKPRMHIEERTGYGGRIYRLPMWIYPSYRDVYLHSEASTAGYDGRQGARLCKATYGKEVYCWQLRQLNSRELKKLGLKNK